MKRIIGTGVIEFALIMFLCFAASVFAEETSGLVVDPNGKVGIGLTDPRSALEVNGSITISGRIEDDVTPGTSFIDIDDDTWISGGTNNILFGGMNNLGVAIDSNNNTSNAYVIVGKDAKTPYDPNWVTLFKIQEDGNVGIGVSGFGSGATNVLGMASGTAPASSPAGMIQLYATDYDDGDGTASSELFVRDEDGNAVDLSPHIFALFDPAPEELLPWAYYAENNYLGKRINVDMAGAIRALEKLTGQQFIYYEDIAKVDAAAIQREAWKEKWITDNTTETEISKAEAFESVEVEVEDTQQIIGEDITYSLEGEDVKEIRQPVFAKKLVQKRQLKSDVRFDTTTGKFYKRVQPSQSEAEAAAGRDFQVNLKKWVTQRLSK